MSAGSTTQAVAEARQTLDRAAAAEKLARAELEEAMAAAAAAGASQREIAASAAVSQPHVSQVLAKRERRFVARSPLGRLLASRRDEVIAAVNRHGASNVVVFGSVARGVDGPDSDVDLAVAIAPSMGLLGLARLELELEEILGVGVDVVPDRLLRPEVRGTYELDAVAL